MSELMSELLEPLHWVSGLFIVLVALGGMVVIDIAIDKYRVMRKLELKATRLEQLLSSHIGETKAERKET